MSDDDYVADSPFDGLEDYYFWDDCASQDVADNLAEHTMPSPVYLEDPAYEMMGGYSDWEYYSDDYYDDDPKLLRNNPQAGSPPASLKSRSGQASVHKAQRRFRRRKLLDTAEIPSPSLDGSGLVEIVQNIGQNIIGTTWKIDKPDSTELYNQGEAKRVALLKDWRTVFRESQPKSDRRAKGMPNKPPELQDEWANDLSLADMGLMTATSKHISTVDVGNDYDQAEDEEAELAQSGYFEDGLSGSQGPALPVDEEPENLASFLEDDGEEFYAAGSLKVKAQSLQQLLSSRKRKKLDQQGAGPSSPDSDDESEVESRLAERILPTPKKMKTGLESSASPPSTPKSNTTRSTNGTQKRGERRPEKETVQHAEDRSTITGKAKNPTANPTISSALMTKKRKTTEAAVGDDDGGTVVTTASSRAKRVALDNKSVRNDDGNQVMTSLAEPTTGRARTRKEMREKEQPKLAKQGGPGESA